MGVKTAVRQVFRQPCLEQLLRRWTRNRPADGILGRLAPQPADYPVGSIREFERYRLCWRLDVSDIIGWYLWWGFETPSHNDFLTLCHAGDVVLDVGANVGATALRAARKVGSDGHVYAVEPNPAALEKLNWHLQANDLTDAVSVHPVGVGARSARGQLAGVPERNLGAARLAHDGGPIRIVTLDDLAGDLERIDVVKIDIEGDELAALAGAQRLIERHRPRLFVEASPRTLRVPVETLTGTLESMDYRVVESRSGADVLAYPT